MKQSIIPILFLVAVIALATAAKLNLLAGVGFTTLTLQKVEFLDTYDPILSSNVWILTTIPMGMSQWVEGSTTGNTYYSPQLQDKGYQATRNLKIDIANHKQRCDYPIQVDTNLIPIYSFGLQCGYSLLASDGEIKADCQKYGTVIATGKPVALEKCCFYGTKSSANVARLPTEANRLYETIVTLQNGQETYTGTLSNWQSNFVQLGNIAYVQGIDLSSGLACPSSDAFFTYGSGTSWKLISKANYDIYVNSLNTLSYTIFNNPIDVARNNVANLNNQANVAKGEVLWSGAGWYATGGLGSWEIIPTWTISNPIIVFYVKADWLGVVQPEGIPDITSKGCPVTIGSAGGGINFDIKNIGTGRGTANIWVECLAPVSQYGGNVQIPLEKSQTVTSAIGIQTVPVDVVTTVTCTLHAKILSKEDTDICSVKINPDQLCADGFKTCRNNQIQQCNDFGTDWNIIEDCGTEKTCKFEGGQPKCVSNNECPLGQTRCANGACAYNCNEDYTWYIIGAIATIALFGGILLGRKKK